MLSKTELYISVVIFVVLFMIICWLISWCDGNDVWWQCSTQNVTLDSLAQYSPWLSPIDYAKAWIITQNDFVDGKYIYAEKEKKVRGDSKGEIECRNALERIFSKPFHKARPNFLNNSVTSNNLELDCYNEEIGLGVEYHGVQHYKYVPYFHSSKEAFMNQKYRDEMKRSLCKQNNIKLIEVPYTVPVEDIEAYLRERL